MFLHNTCLTTAILLILQLSTMLHAKEKPNIVYILCDDLGYGDVHCLAPKISRIPTPHMDRFASEGMIFTDAHSGSSVCSPTRYGLLTGRYSWRTRLQQGVLAGYAPCLISPERPTVASFLQANGYYTALIGKWHLDYQYLNPNTRKSYNKADHQLPPIGALIPDGPIHRGFDYFHGFHHSRHMEAVVENDRVIEYDKPINMLPRLTQKSVAYIQSHESSDKPFFLYIPLNSPHTPILPSPEWKGKSQLGDYGDFVMQTDHSIGEILDTLKQQQLSDNTIVIITSDNGCSRAAGIQQLARKGHRVSANWRGSKADIWDGGHRVPFMIRWPEKIKPGSRSTQLICLTDLFATLADLLETQTPENSCEDSISFLPALSGNEVTSSRNAVIHHSISGHFAYRQGDWKLILARGSGGWTSPTEKEVASESPEAQLYHLINDPGEQNNLYAEEPDIATKLLKQLKTDVFSGRTTSGPVSENDLSDISLWKSERTSALP